MTRCCSSVRYFAVAAILLCAVLLCSYIESVDAKKKAKSSAKRKAKSKSEVDAEGIAFGPSVVTQDTVNALRLAFQTHQASDFSSSLSHSTPLLGLAQVPRDALYVHVLSLERLQRLGDIVSTCEKLLHHPRETTGDTLYLAHFTRGRILRLVRDFSNAMASLRAAEAIVKFKGKDEKVEHLQFEMGNVLWEQGNNNQAVLAFRRATKANPQLCVAHLSAGMVESDTRISQKYFADAVACEPTWAMAVSHLGQQYYINWKDDDANMGMAVKTLERALKLEPDLGHALYFRVHLHIVLSDWGNMLEQRLSLMQKLAKRDLDAGTVKDSTFLWVQLLVYPIADTLINRLFAKKAEFVTDQVSLEQAQVPPIDFANMKLQKGPITVGYLSSDFRSHPVATLFVGVPKVHNRTRVSPVMFNVWPRPIDITLDSNTETRDIKRGSDGWVDISTSHMGHAQAAMAIRDKGVTVLVDMNGHHLDGRPQVAALRPAAVSVLLYGFPSSTQSRYMDFIATDSLTSPPEYCKDYSERLLIMPPSYWPASHASIWPQLLDTKELTRVNREQAGIPESASVVYASFNSNLKITPQLFEAWMRVLQRVPGSILWFVKIGDGKFAEPYLRASAKRLGVDPIRLVFTDSVQHAMHLYVKTVADVLLDTSLYNAHSTGIDALYAGLPMLTLASTRMAGRVGASLLRGHGQRFVNILQARDIEDYEELAVRLVTKRVRRAANNADDDNGRDAAGLNAKKGTTENDDSFLNVVKRDIVSSRSEKDGLFDTAAWVSRWETGLRLMSEVRALTTATETAAASSKKKTSSKKAAAASHVGKGRLPHIIVTRRSSR